LKSVTRLCAKGALMVLGACVLLSGTAWAGRRDRVVRDRHRRDDVVVVRDRDHHHRDHVVVRDRHHDNVVIVRDRPVRRDVVVVHEPVVRHRDVIVSSPYVVTSPSFSTSTFSIAAPIRVGGSIVDVGFSTTRVHSGGVVVGSH
jgi:hypothetical protein